jgi:ABC-type amino acid transport substrate-binding protein
MLFQTRLWHRLCVAMFFILQPDLSGAENRTRQPLRVAIPDTVSSFSIADEKGQLSGFNVDFANAICAKLARDCHFDTRPFPDILPAVASGADDLGVGNYLRTPAREKQVHFTRPYWRSTSSFAGKPDHPLPPLDEIKLHHKICLTQGSRQLDFMAALPGKPDAVVVTQNNQDAFNGLRDGRCSLILQPTMQVLGFLRQPEGKAYAFLGKPLGDHGLGGDVHMVVRPDGKALLKQVDTAIQELIADGTHERLSRQYFPFKLF